MLRLLIVDDEQIIREALTEMIDYHSLGYELIGSAKNGMEAYDIICDQYPDVVITDLKMPILSGLDLIEKARKTDQSITFIILSGFGEFEYAQKAMKYGVSDYLLKPTRKTELIETLLNIKKMHEQRQAEKQKEQDLFLSKLQLPLSQGFMLEALDHPENFAAIYRNYKNFLKIPDTWQSVLFAYYLEENTLQQFVQDINRLIDKCGITRPFPLIYVRNTALIPIVFESLKQQEHFKSLCSDLNYQSQSTEIEYKFMHAATTEDLFREIMKKISRYERILLIDQDNSSTEVINNLTSTHKLQHLTRSVLQSQDTEHSVLEHAIFCENFDLQNSKTLLLSIFLDLSKSKQYSIDFACDFFRKLYTFTKAEQLQDLFHCLFQNEIPLQQDSNSNIATLKNYVEQHLDSENLSLKWLAENLLFVNVGYLSKQFIKEEGIRFSDYLNQKRMEEAVHLMVYYKNDNIKNIAKQVGFGNNPQYFSQVFKKYQGCTPSEYLESLKDGSQNPS